MYRAETNKILAYWYGRSLTAREAFAQITGFVLRLRERSSLFDTLYAMVGGDYASVKKDLSDLEVVLSRDVDRNYNFINNGGPNTSFTLDSRSRLGFHGSLTDTPNDADRTVLVQVACGQTIAVGYPTVAPNSVIIEFAPYFETQELLRELFEETILFWRPTDGTVTNSLVTRALDHERGELKLGWLTYIADSAVADALPSHVARQPFADGMLIQAAEHPGTDSDPDYLARLGQLRSLLRPGGWLNRPVYGTKFGEQMPDIRDVRARRTAGIRPS